jgi:hypothetical protein
VPEAANRASDSGCCFSTSDGRVEAHAEKLSGPDGGAHGNQRIAKRLWG